MESCYDRRRERAVGSSAHYMPERMMIKLTRTRGGAESHHAYVNGRGTGEGTMVGGWGKLAIVSPAVSGDLAVPYCRIYGLLGLDTLGYKAVDHDRVSNQDPGNPICD